MTSTFPRTMAGGLGVSFQRGTAAFGPWVDVDHTSLRDQMATMVTAPTFPPFKFEPRRARIDWRLLHGIDITAMTRDVDLDTLEKIVNIVAFGDIEAEDTRHLTELNFIKIFRLSQMMIEYLLYVQDCLQSSNGWLQQDRGNMDKYVQAARLRIREQEANLKMSKRELRRARKTIKTYELLAVLNDGKGLRTVTLGGPATTTVTVMPPATAPPPPPPQVVKVETNPVSAAMEALLRKELATLAERLSRATVEAQSLRSERDDLYQAVKELEVSVRTRGQMSGTSSPPGYARQNAESAQAIQGLQDQLRSATAEISKLRNEKVDLTDELDRVNGDKRQLQDEKGRLLTEIAARPADASFHAGRSGGDAQGNDNLGSMLLDAERQKEGLQEQLDEARAEVTALQKQLMKAMKATAFGPSGGLQSQGSDELTQRAMREFESARAQLERELADTRRNYEDHIRQLQDDLEMTQTRAVEADRRLAEARSGGDGSLNQATVRMGVQPGGLVKVVEERRPHMEDDVDQLSGRRPDMLAEYEAMNDRLNSQLVQLKEERNVLAGEVERLRSQLEGRAPKSPGDPTIGRDWRTEEMERLNQELDGSRRRSQELEDILRERDAMIERLRNNIRELQMELEERKFREQQEAADAAAQGRVKQQVKQYERLAGPSQHFKTSSFSFLSEDLEPPVVAGVDTPTSARKPPQPELPPRSPQSSPPQPISPGDQPAARISAQQLQRPPMLAGGGASWLQRIPRPAPSEAYDILQRVLQHVQGKQPEQIQMQLQEEIRPQTLNPYEFEDDDEVKFRSMMPHEVPERRGVLGVQPHELQDLALARSMLTDTLLEVVDDQVAQFGLDPRVAALSDKTYAACMVELERRRSLMLERAPPNLAKRATDLRDGLLTHLELIKREAQKEQQAATQRRLQEELSQQAAADAAAAAAAADVAAQTAQEEALAAAAAAERETRDRANAPEIQPAGAFQQPPPPPVAPVRTSSGLRTGSSSLVTPAVPASVSMSLAPPAPSSSGTASYADSPTAAMAAAPGPGSGAGKMPLPAFPARQPSLTRSTAASEANTDDLRSMLPAAGGGFRPATGTFAAGRQQGADSARVSPVPSPLNQSLEPPPRTSGNLNASIPSSHNSSLRSAAARQSTPAEAPVAFHGLTKEVAGGPTQMVSGFMRPAGAAGPPPREPVTVAAPTPAGNMNMSIRSVRQYEDSEYDEEEEIAPPRPKALTRVTQEDDEYSVTEDEEGQEDLGIEESEEGFSPIGAGPRILARVQSPTRASPVQPSRLGPQRTSAAAQSRGWGMDEPLQASVVAPTLTSQRPSETADTGEMESLQSFNGGLSGSLPRNQPGAWGSPAGTIRKQSTTQPPQQQRELSKQLSITSKQSGWNETIKSFGANSIGGDEIQTIQDMTAMESFTGTESIRPASRFTQQQQPMRGAPQAQPAQLKKPVTYDDDDFSDVEEL